MQKMRNKRRPYPKKIFLQLCDDNDWRVHNSSFHETDVNSNKLCESHRSQPSFILDRDFKNLGEGVSYVEIKSISKTGFVRFPKREIDLHITLHDPVYPVEYALYNHPGRLFTMITLDELRQKNLFEDDPDDDRMLIVNMEKIYEDV